MADAPQTTDPMRSALVEIMEDWPEPMPLGSPHRVLLRMWMRKYYSLQNIARKALGEPTVALSEVRVDD